MLDFPSDPINGQQFLAQNGSTYQWATPPNAWTIVAGSGEAPEWYSPALTGDPTAPTPPPGDDDTSIATTEFVQTAINAVRVGYSVADWGADGIGNAAVDTPAFQAAANAAAAAGGGVMLVPAGTYRINTAIQLGSGTTVEGTGEASLIIADAALALTAPVFVNDNTTVTVAFTRTDRDIAIRKLKFDGSERPYPKYLWNTATNTPVTNPATDPTRNAAYATSGYMIQYQNATNCVVEDCIFVDHGSFCISMSGCLQSGTRRNYFERCGRIDYSSNCIYLGHTGTMRHITAINNSGADTILTMDSANASLTGSAQVYITGVAGLSGLLPDGLYAVKSSTSTTITLENDCSAGSAFIMNGRAMVGMTYFTYGEQLFSEFDRAQDIHRCLVQAGTAVGVNVVSPIIRNAKESGVFAARACDLTISNANIDHIDIADIVSSGIELNLCVNVKIVAPILRRSQSYAVTVVGCIGLDITDMTIDEAQNHAAGYTTPYGPFNESGRVITTINTTSGSPTAIVASGTGILIGMPIITPTVPGTTTVSNIVGTTVTMSANATGNATAAAVQFNPVEGPGIPLPDTQRFNVFLCSSGAFPVERWAINGGNFVNTGNQLVGGILMTRSGAAPAGSVRDGCIRGLDLTDMGLRGRVFGVSSAAAAVITTSAAHGLASGNTVWLRGISGPIAVNGGPHTITVLSATTFSIPVNTSAASPFVDSKVGLWAVSDPDRDFDYTTTTAMDRNTVTITGCPGTKVAGDTLVEVFTPSGSTYTWTKPPGAKRVMAEAQGAGGGGGGGARTASGVASSGGAAGGAGSFATRFLEADTLGATVTITIGNPGVGGNGATIDGTVGVDGTAGADASFDTTVKGFGGGGGAGGQVAGHSGGGAGAGTMLQGGSGAGATAGAASASNGVIAGGSNTAGGNGTTGGSGGGGGGNGAAGFAGGQSLTGLGGGGGGSGAGVSTTPAAFNGGNSGRPAGYYTSLGGGLAGGGFGNSPVLIEWQSGPGGGGGGSNIAGIGGAGGFGRNGGGGGGGGSAIGGNGGRGGDGGIPFVRVTTTFN